MTTTKPPVDLPELPPSVLNYQLPPLQEEAKPPQPSQPQPEPPRKPNRWGLRPKLITAAVALATLPMVGAGFTANEVARQELSEQVLQLQQQEASSAALQLEGFLRDRRGDDAEADERQPPGNGFAGVRRRGGRRPQRQQPDDAQRGHRRGPHRQAARGQGQGRQALGGGLQPGPIISRRSLLGRMDQNPPAPQHPRRDVRGPVGGQWVWQPAGGTGQLDIFLEADVEIQRRFPKVGRALESF